MHNILRQARERAGVPQVQIARDAGVSPQYVWQVERGIRRPTLDDAERMYGGVLDEDDLHALRRAVSPMPA